MDVQTIEAGGFPGVLRSGGRGRQPGEHRHSCQRARRTRRRGRCRRPVWPEASSRAGVRQGMQTFAIPGAAVGVVCRGQVCCAAPASTRCSAIRNRVDADTVFRIASTSKMVHRNHRHVPRRCGTTPRARQAGEEAYVTDFGAPPERRMSTVRRSAQSFRRVNCGLRAPRHGIEMPEPSPAMPTMPGPDLRNSRPVRANVLGPTMPRISVAGRWWSGP